MNSIPYRKAVNYFFFAAIVALIILPDMVFGLVLGIVHIVFELVHMLFEYVEVILDHIVEHIFETDLHQTQVIVFYLMLSIAVVGLYYLWQLLPQVYHQTKENLFDLWLEQKTFVILFWREQSLIDKIKLAAISAVGVYCIVLFNF